MQYFEVNYAADEGQEQRRLHASAWHLLHAIAARQGAAFKVSFPYWKDPVKDEAGRILRPGVFGPILRVFADDATLAALHQELCAHRLVSRGEVTVSGLRDVPATTESVAFVRSRANDRVTAGYQVREERRLARNAQKGSVSAPPARPGFARSRQAEVRSNFLSIRSGSNGHHFSLNVERIVSGYRDKSVNSYGLGGLVPSF